MFARIKKLVRKHKMKKVTAIVIGAGNRGSGYAQYSLDFPEKLQIVGVAEPKEGLRNKMKQLYSIPDKQVFTSWEDIAALPKFADCAFVTTQDQMHKAPAVALANKGYHILLEKPMAVTYKDCCEIVDVCQRNNVLLGVCHVLRYTPQACTIKRIIESGAIGEVVNIQHLEPVGFWHFAHSYVRGNWRNTNKSTFSLLAKCGHDIDLLEYWMGDKSCRAISSMGSLKHFIPQNKPAGAGTRCMECPVERSCPYSASEIYLGCLKMGHTGWPVDVISEVVDIENVTEALKSGPYGRCVYDCDNDVMDNQVVSMQYEGGATCTMSMVAFTEKVCGRQTRVFGTKGELSCDFDTTIVRQYDFLTQQTMTHDVSKEISALQKTKVRAHGGADFFAMQAFIEAIATGDASKILTGPAESLRSHYLCFAAEKARLENSVLDLSQQISFD